MKNKVKQNTYPDYDMFDCFKYCKNCPYKKVGLTCYDKERKSCVRTDMQHIDNAFWKKKNYYPY